MIFSQPLKDAAHDKQRVFMVYENYLLLLLRVCRSCASLATVYLLADVSGQCVFFAHCSNNHRHTWSTCGMVANLSEAALDVSQCILFAGASATTMLRVLSHMRMSALTYQTYLKIQKYYLLPTISWVCDIMLIDPRCCNLSIFTKY